MWPSSSCLLTKIKCCWLGRMPSLKLGFNILNGVTGFKLKGDDLAHQGLTKICISTSVDWLPLWRERATSTLLPDSHFEFCFFSSLEENNSCEKGNKEGKSSECRLVFRQINSRKLYIGNLNIWIFFFLRAVRYSSIRGKR